MAFDDKCQPRWSAKRDVLKIWPKAHCKRRSGDYGGSSPIVGYIVYRDADDTEGCRPAGRAEDAWRNAWMVATRNAEWER